MKVNVLQSSDISFKKWRWWSDWVDVCVFTGAYSDGYILQMKVSRSNSKRFKCVKFKGLLGIHCPSINDSGDLMQMSRGEA